MWARITELLLGVWLLASPLLFSQADELGLLLFDIGTGIVLIALAILSLVRPLSHYHAFVPILGFWLITAAFLSGPHPIPAAQQNHIMVGLVVLMLGIVPNQATRPPRKWREFDSFVGRGEHSGPSGTDRSPGGKRARKMPRARAERDGTPPLGPRTVGDTGGYQRCSRPDLRRLSYFDQSATGIAWFRKRR